MFKNIFSFNGRIRRTEFGISYIIYFVVYLFLLAVTGMFHQNKELFFVFIPLVWFLLAQGSKRCHDLGKSGWWQIIPFYVLWLLFQDGDPNENEYGENPKFKEVFDAESYEDPIAPPIYDVLAANAAADIIDDAVMMDLAANEQQAVNDSAYLSADDNTSSDWDNSDSSDDSGSYDDADSSGSDDDMDSF
jgi:uncharacterized membrane protein YhaH (DUF805 family)